MVSEGDYVLGTVYELSESDVRNLDRFEGIAQGNYRKEMITVDAEGQGLNCLVYIDPVVDEGPPKEEYIARINYGIRNAAFPEEYVTKYLRPFVPAGSEEVNDMSCMKKRILFLCTHNSCRSQMAEALANHYLGSSCQAFSAGTEATRVNPLAALVLTELGIDTSFLRSKTMDEFAGQTFDHVVTLCGDAHEKCPLFFGGVQRIHQGFEDPSRLTGSEEEVLPEFRRVRDEIRNWIIDYFGVAP